MNKDLQILDDISKEINAPIEIRNIDQLKRRHKQPNLPSDFFEQRPFRAYVDDDGAQGNSKLAITDEQDNVIRLYLNGVNFPVIPKSLYELHHLQVLSIHRNGLLKDIPAEINELNNLEILYLGFTPIKSISKEIVTLPRLKDLRCERLDKLIIPPKEIAEQGLDATKNYFESIQGTTEVSYLYEAKLVLVGRGFAGKTSLVRKLTIPSYQLEQDIRSTEGIDIKFWDLPMPLEKGSTFRFNIWDLGGQEKYDATHQFFITERTLYLFVTEARQESNYLDFDYWLNIVQMLGNESPLIVVQNKIDQRQKQLPTQKYLSDFPNIVGFVDVSCADGYENTIEDLKRLVKRGVMQLPQLGDELPIEWIGIRKHLKSLDFDYITYEAYVEICSKYGLSKEKANFLSQYYHDLGVIVHYQKDPLLKKLVVINPDWCVDGVYSVLDTKRIERNNGRFNNGDLESIWSNLKYKDKHPELLALMKNYEICFEFGNSGIYIAPELLSPNPVDYKPIKKPGHLTFIYRYEFMPAGILTRFIVKVHNLIDGNIFWKHGVAVKFENARASIVENETKREIVIEIEGESEAKKNLMAILRQEFMAIYADFNRKILYDEYVPCICNECRGNDDIQHFYKWEELLKYSKSNIEKIRCGNSLQEIKVEELLGEISDSPHVWSYSTPELQKVNTVQNLLPKSNSILVSTIVGLIWWGTIALTIFLFAATNINKWYLLFLTVSFIVVFTIFMSFALVEKEKLKEGTLLEILKLSFANIPGLKWIKK